MSSRPGDERTLRLAEPDQPRVAESRGAEVLLRVASAAIGGLVLVLGLIATSHALDPVDRAWASVIGLSAIMAVAAFWGVARTEANKTRLQLEIKVQSIREEMRSLIAQATRDNEIPEHLNELTRRVMQLSEKAGLGMEAATRQRKDVDETLADLAETVRGVGKVVVGLVDLLKDKIDQETEMYTEAVRLGRELEREEARRHDDGGSAPA